MYCWLLGLNEKPNLLITNQTHFSSFLLSEYLFAASLQGSVLVFDLQGKQISTLTNSKSEERDNEKLVNEITEKNNSKVSAIFQLLDYVVIAYQDGQVICFNVQNIDQIFVENQINSIYSGKNKDRPHFATCIQGWQSPFDHSITIVFQIQKQVNFCIVCQKYKRFLQPIFENNKRKAKPRLNA